MAFLKNKILSRHQAKPFILAWIIASVFLLSYPEENLYPSYSDDFGTGARILAMGGSGLATGDDIYSSALNPATLAYLKRGQLAFEYGRLNINLTDQSLIASGFAGIAWPFIREEITEHEEAALSSTETVRIKGKITRTLSSAIMFGYKNTNLAGYYSENIYRLTYARFFGKRLALGVSAKAISDEFIIDEYLKRSPVFDYGLRNSKNSYTADAGFIWNPIPRFFVGASVIDLTEPDIGYFLRDNLPATYRFGIGTRKSDSRYAIDLSYRPTSVLKEFEVSSGFEKTYRDKLSLRGGFAWNRTGQGFSAWRVSLGAGFNISESITLDYSLIYPLTDLKETYGSHYISFVFQFGSLESSEELEPGSLERAYMELKEEKFRLETRLSKTESEKRKLEEVLIEEATTRIREKIKQTRDAAQREEASKRQEGAGEGQIFLKTGDTRRNITASRTHIVKKGDTLQNIAEKYYNDPKLWIEIYNANRDDIGRGGTLKPNQVLIIPPPPSPVPGTQSLTGQSAQPSGATITPSASVQPATITPASAGAAITPSITPVVTPVTTAITDKPLIVPAVVEQVEKIEVSTSSSVTPQPAKIKPQDSTRPAVSPKAPTTTTATAAGRKTHIVKPGENLRSIAEKYYNTPEKWRVILDANKDKITRGQVRPGMELTIP